MPICGDQDGSESPLVFQCPDFVPATDVQTYQVPGTDPTDLRFDFVFREASYNNELGYFKADSASGAVGGLNPGDPGYLAAAFQRASIIFPSGSDAFTQDVTLHLNGGDILVFFIIQNSTLVNFLANNPNNDLNNLPLAFFAIDRLNPDGIDHLVGFQNTSNNYTEFGFEDLTGGGDLDYDDIVYTITPPLQPLTGQIDLSPLSVSLQVGQQHTLTATVTNMNGDPLSGILVTFTVTGANAQSGSANTGTDGKVTFSYSGANSGTDTIVASATVGGQTTVSNSVFADWATGNPSEIDYFALGDSIASGHGLMDDGTACHRSFSGYPDTVLSILKVRYQKVNFVLMSNNGKRELISCSGATAVFNQDRVTIDPNMWLGNQVQFVLQHLTNRPTLVSVTVGVDDFEWANEGLFYHLIESDESNENWLIETNAKVALALRNELEDLLAHQNVAVVLTVYPNPFNKQSIFFDFGVPTERGIASCRIWWGGYDKCYTRTENIISSLNFNLFQNVFLPLSVKYPNQIAIANSLRNDFRNHESPKPSCGKSTPKKVDSWIQYVGEKNVNSELPFILNLRGRKGDCFHLDYKGAEVFGIAVAEAAKDLGRLNMQAK